MEKEKGGPPPLGSGPAGRPSRTPAQQGLLIHPPPTPETLPTTPTLPRPLPHVRSPLPRSGSGSGGGHRRAAAPLRPPPPHEAAPPGAPSPRRLSGSPPLAPLSPIPILDRGEQTPCRPDPSTNPAIAGATPPDLPSPDLSSSSRSPEPPRLPLRRRPRPRRPPLASPSTLPFPYTGCERLPFYPHHRRPFRCVVWIAERHHGHRTVPPHPLALAPDLASTVSSTPVRVRRPRSRRLARVSGIYPAE